MNFIPNNELENRAIKLLRASNTMEVPVPVERIALYLSIAVEQVPLGEGVSGVLIVTDGKGRIGVNMEQSLVRQRFTIAHEVGHYVLHRELSDLFIDKEYVAFRNSESAKGAERGEIQANIFAASLLMPKELVVNELSDQLIDIESTDVIAELAHRFGVSERAMTIRLTRLSLL